MARVNVLWRPRSPEATFSQPEYSCMKYVTGRRLAVCGNFAAACFAVTHLSLHRDISTPGRSYTTKMGRSDGVPAASASASAAAAAAAAAADAAIVQQNTAPAQSRHAAAEAGDISSEAKSKSATVSSGAPAELKPPYAWDSGRGYVIACLCQGRFGNQFDYLLVSGQLYCRSVAPLRTLGSGLDGSSKADGPYTHSSAIQRVSRSWAGWAGPSISCIRRGIFCGKGAEVSQ